ncbi:MAG TPA: hypothetical protein VFT29_00035 [Gemmatimonadaceae bacterium]|nr:hypothetical protein [Gemmatimonadaceae bacterium]
MIGSLLRLIAIRPLLSLAILGFPVILLIAVGLLTIMALKFFVFVVVPIVVVVWLLRKLFSNGDGSTSTGPSAS